MMQLMQTKSNPLATTRGLQSKSPLENGQEISVVDLSEKEAAEKSAEFAALIAGAQGSTALVSVPVAAEKMPETRQTAASLNTGAIMAGPQPWNKNWVFQDSDRNPEIQTLARDEIKAGALGPQSKTLLELFSGNKETAVISPEQLRALLSQSSENMTSDSVSTQDVDGLDSFVSGSLEAQELEQLAPQGGQMQNLSAAKRVRSHQQPMNSVQNSAVDSLPIAAKPALVSGTDFLAAKTQMQTQRPSGSGETLVQRDPGETGAANIGSSGMEMQLNRAEGSASKAAQSFTLVQETVNGQVVSGSMAKQRLSSDSVVGMSQSLMRLSAQGGGEIRMRLKPEGLGEVRIGVTSQGNQIALTVQAADEKVKRIVEESLGSLKDALASQSLVLAKVELQTAPQSSSAQMGMESEPKNSAFQNQAQFGGQGSGDANQRQWSGRSNETASDRQTLTGLSTAQVQSGRMAHFNRGSSANGRLDIRA